MDRELADFLAWLDLNGGRNGTGVTVTVTRGGSSATLTSAPAVVAALFDVARLVEAGVTPLVLPAGRDVSTQQAADVIGVSRTRLRTMLDDGVVPWSRVGTHRRVRLADALAARRNVLRRTDDEQAMARLAIGEATTESRPAR